MKCPFCHFQELDFRAPPSNCTTVNCKICGKFSITAEALLVLKDDAWKLSSYVAEQNRRGVTPLFYSMQKSVPKEAPVGSVGVDAAIQSFPGSTAERLDRALMNLASATQHLGQNIKIGSEGANPLLLAQNTTEVFFVIQEFAKEGYVKGQTTALPTIISLTAKGLNRAGDLQRGLLGPLNKQVFVAMSFDRSLDIAWTEA
jgi:hypothetical protein